MKHFIRPLPLLAGGIFALVTGCLMVGGCKRPSGAASHASNIVTVTEANFQSEVLASTKPVLVDFWAVWCPPCKALAPIIDEIAVEFDTRVKVAKVDVDTAPALAQRYGIQAIPTVLMFRDGKVADQFTGVRSKMEIQRQLEKLLPPDATGSPINEAAR
jgi:thioredoxin 1